MAFVHTAAATAVMLAGGLAAGGPVAPGRDLLILNALLAVVCAAVSGKVLSERGVRHPYLIAGAAAGAPAYSAVLAFQNGLLFLLLPVPLVFAALAVRAFLPPLIRRASAATPAVVATVATALFLTDGALRFEEAQEESDDAMAGLSRYETVAVLDAPGWTLTHVLYRGSMPELVYRDMVGRVVLVGSTLGVATDYRWDKWRRSTEEILSLARCGTVRERPRETHCEKRDGALIVEMEAAPTDREHPDDTYRWPSGWTEARIPFADGRAARVRTDSPMVDLAALSASVQEVPLEELGELRDEWPCRIRCPVWRSFPG